MPRPFTSPKTELQRITELQPIKLPNGLMYPREEVEQRTQSGNEIDSLIPRELLSYFMVRGYTIFYGAFLTIDSEFMAMIFKAT